MSLVVEDGTGRADADSYVSLAAADAYHRDRGNADWTGPDAAREAALRRATAYLDATYRGRFPGYPAHGRRQALEWPRIGAYVTIADNGRADMVLPGSHTALAWGAYPIGTSEIPRELVAATCEAALREAADPGALAPDLERGGAVRSLKAGSVEIVYAAGASPRTVFPGIDLALVALLMPRSAYSGRAVRG